MTYTSQLQSNTVLNGTDWHFQAILVDTLHYYPVGGLA